MSTGVEDELSGPVAISLFISLSETFYNEKKITQKPFFFLISMSNVKTDKDQIAPII